MSSASVCAAFKEALDDEDARDDDDEEDVSDDDEQVEIVAGARVARQAQKEVTIRFMGNPWQHTFLSLKA